MTAVAVSELDFPNPSLDRADLWVPDQTNETFELTELPRLLSQHRVRDVCDIETYRLVFADTEREYNYDLALIEPKRPRFDIALTHTTPWQTGLDGLNVFVGIQAAKQGIRTSALSNEQPSTGQALGNMGNVSLERDAIIQHRSLDVAENMGRFEAGRIIMSGYSRASMIAFGFAKHAKEMGREVEYYDLLDPCLEHKINIWLQNPVTVARYLAQEVAELAKCMADYSPREAYHLVKTLPDSIPEVIQHIATMPALFSGEAGEMADAMPRNVAMHIILYAGSMFNHYRDWQEKFAEFGNIHVVTEEGHHLTGMHPRVINASVGRIAVIQDMLKDGATQDDLDIKSIFAKTPLDY